MAARKHCWEDCRRGIFAYSPVRVYKLKTVTTGKMCEGVVQPVHHMILAALRVYISSRAIKICQPRIMPNERG
ncbi:hypothetical protein EDC52_11415 [Biostraticola tofi]|uniref:Uncharacterized protein n=1 Tax=Biostraticola tofi TaxID=466109 RepID=A0A4R3YI95_9GAMM|nr:hypothetical protein EDC52_11415 [Biostraticola tofi]